MSEQNSLVMPTKEQLAENIRLSDEWMNAVKRGTFSGDDAPRIAGLLNFLQNFRDIALKQYESMSPVPEFGRPEPKPEPAGATA